jgi:hypothetical protein
MDYKWRSWYVNTRTVRFEEIRERFVEVEGRRVQWNMFVSNIKFIRISIYGKLIRMLPHDDGLLSIQGPTLILS